MADGESLRYCLCAVYPVFKSKCIHYINVFVTAVFVFNAYSK